MVRSHLIFDAFFYFGCHLFPETARARLLATTKRLLQGEDSIAHFTPRYRPWQQRICWDPDGSYHKLYREGAIDIVTAPEGIECFTPSGLQLRGEANDEVQADLVVLATGFNHGLNYPMQGIAVEVDGRPYLAGDHFAYKDSMLSEVPNFAYSGGYSISPISWPSTSRLSISVPF